MPQEPAYCSMAGPFAPNNPIPEMPEGCLNEPLMLWDPAEGTQDSINLGDSGLDLNRGLLGKSSASLFLFCYVPMLLTDLISYRLSFFLLNLEARCCRPSSAGAVFWKKIDTECQPWCCSDQVRKCWRWNWCDSRDWFSRDVSNA